ncbi:MAG: ATP-binding cassette domain-containing protein, partial [Gammaproteobacteria bacterium]|nr:ATP-binding cassette domain-containing protein [Gammaproteobacteria bacterium]
MKMAALAEPGVVSESNADQAVAVDPAIRVTGLSKAYQLYASPRDQLMEMLTGKPRHSVYWALQDIDFHIARGEVVGVIGPNGAGKTTLFRMITGGETPDSGTLRVGDTVTIAYVDQSRDSLDPEQIVWEAISDGRDVVQLGRREVPARSYASSFNFKGPDQQKPVKALSGGERNRLHLAKTLKAGGNLLLLD